MSARALSRALFFPALFFVITQVVVAQEVLDLQDAINIALQNNRTIQSAELDVEKSGDELSAAKTKFFPSMNLSVLAGSLLKPIDFTFDQGVFGTYPGIGPVPNVDTAITTPAQLSTYIVGSVQQPLSQLYKIHLNTTLLNAVQEEEKEKQREQKQLIINQVKKAYYAILQSQSALQYAEEQTKLFHELQRVTDDYVVQQVALKSDSLQVNAKLANVEYEALTARNQLSTAKEQLNILLGRDIRTEFAVNAVPQETSYERDMNEAQTTALQRRPELQQARSQLKQAELDRRIKKAEYIPDISLSFNYISPLNIEIVPANIASVGFLLTWDVYDWGRKGDELAEKSRTIEQAKLGITEAENKILLEVNSNYRKLEESRQLVRVASLSQEAAQENVRVVASKYKEQSALLKDVLQAESSLEQTKDQYQNALLSFWSAKADFEKSLGEEQ
jgi:outer membrane protein